MKKYNEILIIRGGGDLATGVIQKLFRAGMHVLVLECEKPMAIRRTVALCSAIQWNEYKVEDVTAHRIERLDEMEGCWERGMVPVLVDPTGYSINEVRPMAVIDAILAKRNVGTTRQMAPITIGLGPGFVAPTDVNIAIETMRGHNLGRLIFDGEPMKNTGVPGNIGGKSLERVMRAPCEGIVTHHADIGDWLEEGMPVFDVAGEVVHAPFSGMIRGLIAEGMHVPKGMKTADIDPRKMDRQACFTISDKARCLGGAVLEAVLYQKRIHNKEEGQS